MKVNLSDKIWWQFILFLVICGSLLAACAPDAEESALPEGCDGVTWGSGIQVEKRGSDYVALIQGDMPDSCSTVCGSEQTIDSNEININLFSSRPEDMMCSQMLTPFTTEVQLNIEGLDPGEYTVTLNETHATTTFILE